MFFKPKVHISTILVGYLMRVLTLLTSLTAFPE